jgi:IclR family transcriptional regulator, KDG regulon repressor
MTAQLDEGAIDSGAQSTATASVTKALRLLDVFRHDGPVLGVSELARQAGVAKSTAFRLLALLEDADLVERDGTGYRLSWRMFELGTTVQHRWPIGLREIAAPWMTDLFVKSGNVVHLAVMEGRDVLYLEKVSGPNSARTPTAVGARVPINCSSLGKVMLAYSRPDFVEQFLAEPMLRKTPYSVTEPGRLTTELQRIRQAGVAMDKEEAALGLVCVAAPIITGANVVAAISIAGPVHHVNWTGWAALVRDAARRIAIGLGADAAASLGGR